MTMYAKCGVIDKARDLFWGIKGRDLVAWSAAIAAFSQSGFPQEALSLFRDMQNEYSQPNNVTLVSVIPACAELTAVRLGKSAHCHAIKASMDSDVSTGTALVSMYAKCSLFNSAHNLFNKMPLIEVVTWNVLINRYAQIGDCYNAGSRNNGWCASRLCLPGRCTLGNLPSLSNYQIWVWVGLSCEECSNWHVCQMWKFIIGWVHVQQNRVLEGWGVLEHNDRRIHA